MIVARDDEGMVVGDAIVVDVATQFRKRIMLFASVMNTSLKTRPYHLSVTKSR